MIRKILLVYILIVGSASAVVINECQTDIYYGNGIMTTKSEAKIALSDTLKPAIQWEIYDSDEAKMNKAHHFDIVYNYTFKKDFGKIGIIFDLMESYQQLDNTSYGWKIFNVLKDLAIELAVKKTPVGILAKEQLKDWLMDHAVPELLADYLAIHLSKGDWERLKNIGSFVIKNMIKEHHDEDLDEMVKKYKASIVAGHGVIAVTHSQGNLFAVESSDRLKDESKNGWMLDYFYHVSIASPATRFASSHHWLISNDNDPVAKTPGSVGTNVKNYARYFTYDFGIVADDGTEESTCALQAILKLDVLGSEGYWLLGHKPEEASATQECNGRSYTARAIPDEWNWLKIEFHAFNFYMGKTVYPLHKSKNVLWIPPKNPKTDEYASAAHKKIIAAIKEAIAVHKKNSSQWQPKNIGCLCEEKYATMTHRFDKSLNPLMAGQKVKDFAEGGDGKIYPVGTQYVRAACGGVKIDKIDEGDACLALTDEEDKRLGTISGNGPNPDVPGGLFRAYLSWHQTQVHMELSNKLMSKSVSGCGMAAAGSEALSLYDVYPNSYPVQVVNVDGYQDLDDSNLSDDVHLIVKAVTASGQDHYVVTRKYQYPNLGQGGGHVADIVITRPDPAKPPVPRLIPVVPGGYGGGYGSGGSYGGGFLFVGGGYGGDTRGGTHYVPIVHKDPPLCQPAKSCGCLPCEYAVQMYLSQTRLGPISGAHVRLYRADEADEANKTILYEGETSISSDLNKAGLINLPVPYPQQPESEYTPEQRALMEAIAGYDGDFILEVSGGVDIDRDDDLHVDSRFTQVNGTLHLILPKERLLQHDYKVNILTEIAYEVSRDLLGEHYDPVRLKQRLDDVARRVLIEKLYPDASVPLGRDDLMWWIPAAHKKWLLKPYGSTLAPIVEKIYAGEDISEDAYHYVYDPYSGQSDSGVPVLRSQWFHVDENASGGTRIGKIRVESEGNSTIEEFTLSGDGAGLFRLERDGTLSLEANASLDYERTPIYQLRLTARNAQGSSRPVTLYLLVNNIPDVPEDRGFEGGVVSEDAPEGTVVGHLRFDPGAAPIERIELGGRDAASFTVDTNGTLRVSAASALDYERAPAAHITLQAFNALGASRVVPVTITVTDAVDVPIVGMLDVHLPENSPAGTVVGTLQIQSNDPILDVNLSGDGAEKFTVDTNGTVRVAPGADLDYERRANYVLQAVARNVQGSSRPSLLIIRLSDVPDVPRLLRTQLHVSEEAPIGETVGSLRIESNGSAPIEAFRLSGEGSELFAVDTRGRVRTAAALPSHDAHPYYNLWAYARNAQGESLRARVVIYVDTARPELGILDSWVYENAPSGTEIGRVPVASSRYPIRSFALQGDGSELFRIDRNGTVRVAPGAQIDYERRQHYTLQAFAQSEAGRSAPAPVYIRVIDRADTMKIRGFSTRIPEDTPPGRVIGLVSMVQSGGKELDHFTLSGEGSDLFRIDNQGTVRTAADHFDNEAQPSYHLAVRAVATDGSVSAPAWLDIAVDDSLHGHPVLIPADLTVAENSPVGTEVGRVQVADPGSSAIERFALSGAGADRFGIDAQGRIFVRQIPDYEEEPLYRLQVRAYNALTTSAPYSVTIRVRNLPDTPPTLRALSAEVAENAPAGTVVGHLRLADAGEGNITGYTLSGEGAEDFTVDAGGTITVADGADLDYERRHAYTLRAVAQSSAGASAPAAVHIAVINVPEIVPVLADGSYRVEETLEPGTLLAEVQVLQRGDTPIDSFESNESGWCRIDDQGELSLSRDLNWTKEQSFVCRVRAHNAAGYSDWATLSFDVLRIYYEGDDGNNTLTGTQRDEFFVGHAGDDRIEAGGGDDHLRGGPGDDLLLGGSGDDTYYYALGDGNDTLYDEGGEDTLVFEGIRSEKVRFEIAESDLLVILEGNTTLRISNWIGENNKIETLEFEDRSIDAESFNYPMVRPDAGITDLSKLGNLHAAQVVQGRIKPLESGYNSVEHWIFRYDGGHLIIDTLSELNSNGHAYIDIDQDGRQTGVDIYIYLYRKDANGNWAYVASDDDSSQTYGDGSSHRYDSYLSLDLREGEYLLAVGNFYLSSGSALSGRNTAQSYPAGGPYQITFNEELDFIEIPENAQGNLYGTDHFNYFVLRNDRDPYDGNGLHLENPRIVDENLSEIGGRGHAEIHGEYLSFYPGNDFNTTQGSPEVNIVYDVVNRAGRACPSLLTLQVIPSLYTHVSPEVNATLWQKVHQPDCGPEVPIGY